MNVKVHQPVPCYTGRLCDQPQSGSGVCLEHVLFFTPDYDACVDLRGALDAPIATPSGSVRAHDFEAIVHADGRQTPAVRLLVAHTWREGTFAWRDTPPMRAVAAHCR